MKLRVCLAAVNTTSERTGLVELDEGDAGGEQVMELLPEDAHDVLGQVLAAIGRRGRR